MPAFNLNGVTLRTLICCTLCAPPLTAMTREDLYHITPTEKAACTGDAERLCASAFPDENRLLFCMKDNQAALSSSCLHVFNAGLKRRGLNMGSR